MTIILHFYILVLCSKSFGRINEQNEYTFAKTQAGVIYHFRS